MLKKWHRGGIIIFKTYLASQNINNGQSSAVLGGPGGGDHCQEQGGDQGGDQGCCGGGAPIHTKVLLDVLAGLGPVTN